MKRIILIFIAALCLTVTSCVTTRSTQRVNRVEVGMTREDIRHLLGKPYWNQGLCTEALLPDACTHPPRTPLHLSRLHTLLRHPASGRVMEKCGFIPTETYSGESLYAAEMRPIRVLRLQL